MICPKCGASQLEGTKFCTSCGSDLSGATAAPTEPVAAPAQPAAPTEPVAAPTQPVTGAVPPAGYAQPGSVPSSSPSNGKVTAAFVCGILSIVFAFLFTLAGLILGIVAIALGSSAYRETQEQKAKTGKTCGIVGVVLSTIFIVLAIIFAASITALLAQYSGTSTTTTIPTTPSISNNTTSDETAAVLAVQEYLDDNLTFSDSEISALATELDSSFYSTTEVSLSDLGIDSNEFAKWLVGDLDGLAESATIDGDTGTVYVTITTRDFDSFMTMFEASVDAADFTNVADQNGAYQLMGSLMKDAMSNTPVVSRTMTIDVDNYSGDWEVAYPATVASDLSGLIYGGMSL